MPLRSARCLVVTDGLLCRHLRLWLPGSRIASLGEARDTLEDIIEPYLIQQGFLERTPRGRMAGRKAYEHFGLKAPARPVNPDLFSQTP